MITIERHLSFARLGLRAGRGANGTTIVQVRTSLNIVADVLPENVQIAAVELLDSAMNAYLCKQ